MREAAKAAALTLGVKAHADHAVNSPERLLRIIQQAGHPHLALAYDFSHFQFGGYDLAASQRRLLPYVRFVHSKHVALNRKLARFFLPSEGGINYPDYFRWLDDLHYAGPVMDEVSSQIFTELHRIR